MNLDVAAGEWLLARVVDARQLAHDDPVRIVCAGLAVVLDLDPSRPGSHAVDGALEVDRGLFPAGSRDADDGEDLR